MKLRKVVELSGEDLREIAQACRGLWERMGCDDFFVQTTKKEYYLFYSKLAEKFGDPANMMRERILKF